MIDMFNLIAYAWYIVMVDMVDLDCDCMLNVRLAYTCSTLDSCRIAMIHGCTIGDLKWQDWNDW